MYLTTKSTNQFTINILFFELYKYEVKCPQNISKIIAFLCDWREFYQKNNLLQNVTIFILEICDVI